MSITKITRSLPRLPLYVLIKDTEKLTKKSSRHDLQIRVRDTKVSLSAKLLLDKASKRFMMDENLAFNEYLGMTKT